MTPPRVRPTRRSLLALGTGAALATGLGVAPAASADGRAAAAAPSGRRGGEEVTARLRRLEAAHSERLQVPVRLGVFAYSPAGGTTVEHRAGEAFPMCSTFKTLAVAAVLRDLRQGDRFLHERVRYPRRDTEESGYAPVTGRAENLRDGMTGAELCGAAVSYSDNCAANLLLRRLGGPGGVTRFCRSLGDDDTRLDHWEPALNSAVPGAVEDTTTPRAIALTYARLVLGNALPARHRERLTGWLLANTTGRNQLRAGLPRDWALGDKTGAGKYGTNNDVGVAWPPGRPPVVLSVLTTTGDKELDKTKTDVLIAETAALLAGELG
ncbi:class A beta-lactamase [Streptomyces caatingaensis]|uniref:Beta-lactamase n=1 Tax=Streptomyces caatingaensis TaxID=1678637 RepID=A0A0K9XAM5_9ACTN|nr:class A beta-lactamase [Streptomyces caatingaensis]KNB50474.1 beta-lactamase [Streptomyces caatingaensis]